MLLPISEHWLLPRTSASVRLPPGLSPVCSPSSDHHARPTASRRHLAFPLLCALQETLRRVPATLPTPPVSRLHAIILVHGASYHSPVRVHFLLSIRTRIHPNSHILAPRGVEPRATCLCTLFTTELQFFPSPSPFPYQSCLARRATRTLLPAICDQQQLPTPHVRPAVAFSASSKPAVFRVGSRSLVPVFSSALPTWPNPNLSLPWFASWPSSEHSRTWRLGNFRFQARAVFPEVFSIAAVHCGSSDGTSALHRFRICHQGSRNRSIIRFCPRNFTVSSTYF